MADGYLRIGEFGERVGVSPDVLRAWERRYGLLRPDRSEGGFRLYSNADLARVRRVQALVGRGLSVAEAARHTLREADPDGESATGPGELATDAGGTTPGPQDGPMPTHPGVLDPTTMSVSSHRLAESLESYDEAGAQQALDGLFSSFSPETVIREVILPQLARMGQQWEAGELDVAQEHFASNLLRGRLLAMARGWGMGSGPVAVLAAPPGESHDLPLVMFGLALWRQGWRIIFLGSDTPIASLRAAADAADPAIVVLAAADAARFAEVERELGDLADHMTLALAGHGASQRLTERIGAVLLTDDPVTAAEHVTAGRISVGTPRDPT